jgi:hypothetical protein
MGSRGVRPRRGALWLGSRNARAVAAACLAAGVLAAAVPQPAAAYPCGDGAASAAQGRHLTAVPADECRSPETLRRTKPKARTSKRGSISTLMVFVLAIAGALLIPISRNGLPHSGDPFGHDPTHERNL